MTDALPQGWEKVSINDLVHRLQYGFTAKANSDIEEPKFLRITDIKTGKIDWKEVPGCSISQEDFEKFRLNHGDFVFARSGSIEKAARIEHPKSSVFASYLIRGNLIDQSVSGYFKWFIQSPDYLKQIGALGSGIGMQNVNAKKLGSVEINLAPLNEQHRIVEKIDSLMARSGAAKEALDAIPILLDQYRQSVLAAAFRGDLTKDWRENNPDIESADTLLERIRKERRQRWEETELAKFRSKGKEPKNDKWKEKYKEPEPILDGHEYSVPATWAVTTPDNVCSDIVDCPHATAKYTETGKPIVRTTEFRFGKLDLTNVKYVSEETFEKRISRLVPTHGDILYSREGGIFGIACEVPDIDLCMGQRMMMFRANPYGIHPRFLLWMLNSPLFFNQAASKVTGSASPHVNVGDIKRFAISLPPIEEQKVIVSLLEKALEKIEIFREHYDFAVSKNQQLNQSILAKAFKGELVPQDPTDEPASALLERIRTERAAQTPVKKRGRKKSG